LCDLVIEIGMSGAMTEQDPETDEATLVGISVPATDRNVEFYLDVIQRQVFDALTDPDNEWAEVYRGLHYSVDKVEFVGARTNDDGAKMAGRQVRLTVALADDPVRGEALDPETPLLQFLTKLEAVGGDEPTYQMQAAVLRSLLTGSDDPWKSLQRRHDMTASELLAVGLGPLAADELQETPEMGGAALEVLGRTAVEVEPEP
ncbi:MAG TPA: hypothetical protein VGN98_18080, partial [Tianweitania sediminis]|nr:hypothetical protein [Tianweitania sediminis]